MNINHKRREKYLCNFDNYRDDWGDSRMIAATRDKRAGS